MKVCDDKLNRVNECTGLRGKKEILRSNIRPRTLLDGLLRGGGG